MFVGRHFCTCIDFECISNGKILVLARTTTNLVFHMQAGHTQTHEHEYEKFPLYSKAHISIVILVLKQICVCVIRVSVTCVMCEE